MIPGLSGSSTLYTQAGQLLTRTSVQNGIGNTVNYVYLGSSLVATVEPDPANPNSLSVVKYQHTDSLGSPVAVTSDGKAKGQSGCGAVDLNGNCTGSGGVASVIERTDYQPYGAAIGKAVDGVGYTGHLMDGGTGLVYMQQRYYDPGIGRFLSIDPVTANSNTGANFNRYWYANNNPYKFKDPDGREVAGIYSPSNELLFMVDKDTREWALVQGASGGKPFGDPIPAGNYDILERAGRDGFYRLERRDASYGDDESDGRTNLRLHGPGRTIGCVEVCSTDGFKQVGGLLGKTSTTQADVDSKSLKDRIRGRSETLTKFGSLGVLPAGYSLTFNHKTDSVVMRYTETGSRIVKERTICTVSKDGGCK